jgi:GINS complex subunit 1
MWWELGTVIPAEIRQNMSLKEREFFTVYDKLMSTYVSHFPELDLTSDQEPPKELNIEVRVLEDCGDVMTERGVVELKKGSTVFCRRADVSLLIRRGALEQTENKD